MDKMQRRGFLGLLAGLPLIGKVLVERKPKLKYGPVDWESVRPALKRIRIDVGRTQPTVRSYVSTFTFVADRPISERGVRTNVVIG